MQRRYRIFLHPDVKRIDSQSIDPKTREKIKKKCFDLLSQEPEKAGEPLQGALHGFRKLVIFNNYRVVYRVDNNQVVVFMVAVGIRQNLEVYKIALKRLGK